MSIPYQSVLHEDERNISAAFFRMLAVDEETYGGALMLVDARGGPLEFTYNRATVRHKLTWRRGDLPPACTRALRATLLDDCRRGPRALFFLARELEAEVFTEDIDIERPVARVSTDDELIGSASIEELEVVEASQSVQLFWVRGRPSD